MHYYKTNNETEAGRALNDALNTLRREGMECDAQAAAFAMNMRAESYVPALGTDWGGVSALVFPKANLHLYVFDLLHRFVAMTDENGQLVMAENGTPYFTLNASFNERAVRWDKAQRMRKRKDVIVPDGKLKFSAVANMMSRTEIIREGLGLKKPKYPNEYAILKFRYHRDRKAAHDQGREAEEAWNEAYAKLRSRADFKQFFPGLEQGDYAQLEKSRKEMVDAVEALKDSEWSIVVELLPGRDVTEPEAVQMVQQMARDMWHLPIIHFGETHRLLGATPSQESFARPATFCLGDVNYVMLREEAKADGLVEITDEEYRAATAVVEGKESNV